MQHWRFIFYTNTSSQPASGKIVITSLLHVFYYLNALNPFNNNGTFHIVSLVQFSEDGQKQYYIYVSLNLAKSVGPDELPT